MDTYCKFNKELKTLLKSKNISPIQNIIFFFFCNEYRLLKIKNIFRNTLNTYIIKVSLDKIQFYL